jgi:cysteine desulfurase
MKHIYLDYAAATPIDSKVLSAMQPYFSDAFFNPSATYLRARSVTKDLQSARHEIAQSLGVRTPEIIFTAGGSEANNLAVHGIMRRYPGKHLVVGATEHASIIEPAKAYKHSFVAVNPDGRTSLEDLKKSITNDTVLVSIMLANNEIGTIAPIKKVADVIKKIREVRIKAGNKLPLYLHSDICQAVLYLDTHPARLGVDLMTFNGGKIYGPKQSGLLYVKTGIVLDSLIQGGGQERNLRSGTENVPSIIGFSVALRKAVKRHESNHKKLTDLQKTFINLLSQYVPQASLNGSVDYRLPNNIHITIPGIDNERIMMELDERGIECAVGSACSASSDEPSHVLKAIGMTDVEAQSSLRLTMGLETTKEDIETAVLALRECVSTNL